MEFQARVARFEGLHQPAEPLVLYNIWDAGSAKTLAGAGAPALATGSWSVAAAQGYTDGEQLPLPFLLQIVERIVATVQLPLSVDFEGAYAVAPDALVENVAALVQRGVVGVNFEDQCVGATGIHGIDVQAARIAAMRAEVNRHCEGWFINARTDLFLQESDRARHADLVPQAIERAHAYREAGASGFFVPGLLDPALLAQVCEATSLPVNAMAKSTGPSLAELARCGVARISHGPGPYATYCGDLASRYKEAVEAP